MIITRDTKDQVSSITLVQPDDWHLHIRDGASLQAVLPHTVRQFRRALIMPNLKPPVTTITEVRAYLWRIQKAFRANSDFEPLMTLYLTDQTSPKDISLAKESDVVYAVKYYPANATTNSQAGVTDIQKCYPVLERMQDLGMVLCVHGEVTDPKVDVFDREEVFIDRVLYKLVRDFPQLKIVLEHVTTEEGVAFVMNSGPHIGATITAHHLLINRNALFQGGIRPHNYCLPIAKREKHRQALLLAVLSGNPRFFLGTDSAPHATHTKENDCGCAGCFTAYTALELYAEAFEEAGALEKLEGFASFHGADFYGLPRNQNMITLSKKSWVIPQTLSFGNNERLTPFRAGETLPWKKLL